jgi:hypothetical protein
VCASTNLLKSDERLRVSEIRGRTYELVHVALDLSAGSSSSSSRFKQLTASVRLPSFFQSSVRLVQSYRLELTNYDQLRSGMDPFVPFVADIRFGRSLICPESESSNQSAMIRTNHRYSIAHLAAISMIRLGVIPAKIVYSSQFVISDAQNIDVHSHICSQRKG